MTVREEEWGVAFGDEVYVMSESSAREAAQEGHLTRKIDGEWVITE